MMYTEKCPGEIIRAAEGVTLSGVPGNTNRMRTQLWRYPFSWEPKGQGLLLISQAKGQGRERW